MPDNDMNNFLRDYERQQQVERDKAHESLKALCGQLATLGTSIVVGRYDGYGDSGQFDSIEAYSETTDDLDQTHDQHKVELSPDHIEKLADAFFVFLPGGFEINEGGFGNLILDVNEQEIRLEHNHRIEDSVYSEDSWPL